jgi:hypothetical protein
MTCHIMTVSEEKIPDSTELQDQHILRFSDGIRQATFCRLITMHRLMKAEYEERGPVYDDWLNQKGENVDNTFYNFVHSVTVDDYQAIAELGDEYFSIRDDWLEMSDRTAEDYLKTSRAFCQILTL